MSKRTMEHEFVDIAECLPVGKVVCVGRNYAEHAKELNNPIPSEPLLFIKPSTAVVPLDGGFSIPQDEGECQHEAEVAVLIGKEISQVDESDAVSAIVGLGVGLDLTLRDKQKSLKDNGHPWEVAKAFDGSCPLSKFIYVSDICADDLNQLRIMLTNNDEVKQEGVASDMLTPIAKLISIISETFTLLPGDVIMTGTPKGVGPLTSGDKLIVELVDKVTCQTVVS